MLNRPFSISVEELRDRIFRRLGGGAISSMLGCLTSILTEVVGLLWAEERPLSASSVHWPCVVPMMLSARKDPFYTAKYAHRPNSQDLGLPHHHYTQASVNSQYANDK